MDILAKGVFYALFYSFPLSRSKFNDDLKKIIIRWVLIFIYKNKKFLIVKKIDLWSGNLFKNKPK